jgi:hypothetical protein
MPLPPTPAHAERAFALADGTAAIGNESPV